MPGTTLTAESYHKEPSQPVTGLIGAHFRFAHNPSSPTFHPSTFGSSSDVAVLLRIPENAMICDLYARVGTKVDGGFELRFIVTPASLSPTTTLAVIGSLSCSVLSSPLQFRPTAEFAPFRISYSSAQSQNICALKAIFINATSATASFSCEGMLFYQMTPDRRGGGTQGQP